MSLPPPPSPPSSPPPGASVTDVVAPAGPRRRPPSGWKVAAVLVGLAALIATSCVACMLGYTMYVDARNNGR